MTPLTVAVYLYGTAPPDHVPRANVIFTFLYLLALLLKLLFWHHLDLSPANYAVIDSFNPRIAIYRRKRIVAR